MDSIGSDSIFFINVLVASSAWLYLPLSRNNRGQTTCSEVVGISGDQLTMDIIRDMVMRNFHLWFFVILVASSQLTVAASLTNEQQIKYFRTGHQANIVLVIGGTKDFTATEACLSAGKAALNPSTPNADKMYSHLLAAYMANKPVKLWVNGCLEYGSDRYFNIEYVYFL